MKSFKVLALLTLAVTLSCGSPTNVTQATDGSTDGFIKVIKRNAQAKDLFLDSYISPIIKAALDASHKKNEQFTKNFVEGMWNNNKNYNYAFCRTKHSFSAVGQEGVDYARQWIRGFDSQSYDLLILEEGTFIRNGKSGYINWAWQGSVKSGQDLHSNVVNFVKPGTSGVTEGGGD
ncbi:hypothetical protein JOM56_011729 [Amanita muscaria]